MSGFSDRTSNPGFTDRWTCPSCYTDLVGATVGRATCPACTATLDLSVDYEPVSIARVVNTVDDDA